MMISAPAIYNFGTEAMKRDVGRKVILGEVNSALAISEPFAGSDVARIRTTAVKTVDGRHYIVNGVKKWITEGCYSDFFVTAVRTGDDGAGGITMLLIERTDDVETTQIKTTYVHCLLCANGERTGGLVWLLT
jgi:alkylation response protein AidB-like acyl-CoA dehydrogenase